MNLYPDIDGVLLGKTDPASPRIVLPMHDPLGHYMFQ